jgi:Asp-tRNA(Asn)/Glu-tRNA(Gln) amidotransferase A subunit family amidase
MNEDTLTRREMLRLGGAATAAVAASLLDRTASAALTGLAGEYDRYDATALAELVARREVTPLELLQAVRLRVESMQPRLNCFSALFFEKAEAQIQAGLAEGPFRGVPFALKDISHQLAGTATTNGSRLFQANVPDFDSTLVERYKKAGLVLFGKTTSPELGLSPSTESILFGKTRNPWSLERTPGGSSGGTAAAVASRVLPMAHGSDGGGSIRIPASCCGVFGLKPTRARVPLGPTVFEGWNGLSVHHALTLSVRDSAALLDASSGSSQAHPAGTARHPFLEEDKDPGEASDGDGPSPASGVPVDSSAEASRKRRSSAGARTRSQEARLPDRCKAVERLATPSIRRPYAGRGCGRGVADNGVSRANHLKLPAGTFDSELGFPRAIVRATRSGSRWRFGPTTSS